MKRLLLVSILIISSFQGHQAQNCILLSNQGSAAFEMNQLVDRMLTGQPVVDSSLWLNYTALVNPTDPGMSVQAEIAAGQIPKGIKLYLEALPVKNQGFENSGRSTGKVEISHIPRTILENIKTAYTGSGQGVGHQLVITFEISDFSQIEPGMSALYLQFTLK